MKQRLIILSILIISILPGIAASKDSNDESMIEVVVGELFNHQTTKYPEERNKEIVLDIGSSPLFSETTRKKKIKELEQMREILEMIEKAKQLGSDILLNKFSMGNGFLDVTYQVQSGVQYALEDTLKGYPEFQRRKITEEILNSSFQSSKITNAFILGDNKNSILGGATGIVADALDISWIFDWGIDDVITNTEPGILKIVRRIINFNSIKAAHQLIKNICASLLIFFIGFKILKSMAENDFSPSQLISMPVLRGLGVFLAMAAIYYLMQFALEMIFVVSRALFQIIQNSGFNVDSLQLQIQNASNWKQLAEQIGYMPALCLGIINILVQIFAYIFITGLILNLVLGIILSPLWLLSYYSTSLKQSSIASFISWLKTAACIAAIPLVYLILVYINDEFRWIENDFLSVCIPMMSIIFLPILFANILKPGTGPISAGFSSYGMIAKSVESSFFKLESLLERKAT